MEISHPVRHTTDFTGHAITFAGVFIEAKAGNKGSTGKTSQIKYNFMDKQTMKEKLFSPNPFFFEM